MNKETCCRSFHLGVLLLVLSGRGPGYSVKSEIKCTNEPIDLAFVLDASTSIYRQNFQKELDFVKYMVDHLNIGMGPKQVRIGVETFSDLAAPQVHLSDSYHTATLKTKIDNITHTKGNTNIGDALTVLLSVMFTREHGSRQNVKQMAIILTDGKSQNREATQEAARACKDANIKLFAVGIGSFNKKELRKIASQPKSKFYHETASFDTLNHIREDILRKTCEEECNNTRKSDVVFMISNNHFGKRKSDRILKAMAEVTSTVESNKVFRFGVIFDKCLTKQDVQVGSITKKSQISFNYGSIGLLVHKLYTDSLTKASRNIRQIGLLFLDRTIDLKQPDLLKEARRALFRNIDLFVVIIGQGVDKEIVKRIVKSKEYIITINSYDDLISDLPSELNKTLCKTAEEHPALTPAR